MILGLEFKTSIAEAWSGTIYIRSDGSIEPSGAPVTTADKITYFLTGNISVNGFNHGLIVERNNIVIDGRGFTIQGSSAPFDTRGVDISGRENVTVKNLKVKGFAFGIYLSNSSFNNVAGNEVEENQVGLIGYRSAYNNIFNNVFRGNFYEIKLTDYSGNNLISQNIIKTSTCGIILDSSSNNNIISWNRIEGNLTMLSTGIVITSCSDNKVTGNSISLFATGIELSYAVSNTIFGNNITLNSFAGIDIYEGSILNIFEANIIEENSFGIRIYQARDNTICGNCFLKNGADVIIEDGDQNYFDKGYPVGGNYWENYRGVDLYSGSYQNVTGADGIGDTPHIDGQIVDRYPLMAPVKLFYAGTWYGIEYNAIVVSNSTISDFHFNPEEGPFISFKATSPEGAVGFCRVMILSRLIWADDGWKIRVDDVEIDNYREFPGDEAVYLYFTFAQGMRTIVIEGAGVIPEYPIIIPLLALIIIITFGKILGRK